MATPSKVDSLIDAASEAREDALDVALDLQRTLHTFLTAGRDAWDLTRKLEGILAREDGRGPAGPLFIALADLRDEPTVRRVAA